MKTQVGNAGRTTIMVVCLALAFAVLLSLLVGPLAKADDVTINASVVDSTPSSKPTQFVTLPIGSSTSAAPTIDIQLTNLEPYSFVQVFAQSNPVLIASGFADKYGVFKAKASLPPNLEPGNHSVTANVQAKGETVATLKTLVQFAVSASGTLQKAPKGGSGGRGGSGTAGSGGVVTESPIATPNPIASTISIGGVLLVGGAVVSSSPTFSFEGSPARVAISLANNYSKAFAVNISVSVTNLFGQRVARIAQYRVDSIKPNTNITVTAITKSNIGQWGFYNAMVTVNPPSKLNGLNLYSVARETSFMVLPVLPLTVLLVFVIFDVFRRLLWPLIKNRRQVLLDMQPFDQGSGFSGRGRERVCSQICA